MEFKDKVVMVTGSTRGIGKEIAKAFAKAGACVQIIGRNEELAAKIRDEIIAEGFLAEAHVCDVTNLQNVQEIIDKVLDKHKRIDILINNAGITKDNLLLRLSEDDWDQVLDINLKGAFICSKVITKVMLKAKQGRIVNISSIIGITGNAGQANYAASKAGLIGFTKSLAKELASRAITVNCVAPGYIETDMTAQLKEGTQQVILDAIPLKRFGKPSDVAGACLFLCSDQASYITGQTIVVDGGMAI